MDKIDNFGICGTCVLEKCLRSLIPRERSSGRAKSPLDLVNSDVCEPVQVPSFGGSRYFVTFTNYCSWRTSVYTMHRKSEIFQKYKLLERFAETYTGRCIRTLCTDKGGDYISEEFEKYLANCGVVQKLSTVETPQHNGESEPLSH